MKRSRRELSIDMDINRGKLFLKKYALPFVLPSFPEQAWGYLKGVTFYCDETYPNLAQKL